MSALSVNTLKPVNTEGSRKIQTMNTGLTGNILCVNEI